MRAQPMLSRLALVVVLFGVMVLPGAVGITAQGDSDGDGLPDSVDACPTQPGPRENSGCPLPTPVPDTDGDGLIDTVDACPTVAGPRENSGCPVVVPPTNTPIPPPPTPIPDSDGDGLPDNADACPTQPGPRENGGCPIPDNPPPASATADSVPPDNSSVGPDSDGDGLPDADDACPFGAGRIEDRGCPYYTPTPTGTLIVPFAGEPSVPSDTLATPPGANIPNVFIPPLQNGQGCMLRNVGDVPYPVVYYDASYTFENIDYPGYIDWEYGVDYADSVSAPEIQAVSADLVALVAPNAWVPIEKQILVPVPGQGYVLVYRLFLGGWMIPDAFPGELIMYVGDPPCPTEVYGGPDIDYTIPEIDLSFLPYGHHLIDVLRPTIPPFDPPSAAIPLASPDDLMTQQDYIDAWADVPGICIIRNSGPAPLIMHDPIDAGDPVTLLLAQTIGNNLPWIIYPGQIRVALARVDTMRMLAIPAGDGQNAIYRVVPHFFIYTGASNFQYPSNNNLIPDYAGYGFENYELLKLDASYADDRVGFIEVIRDDCPRITDTEWWDSLVPIPFLSPWAAVVDSGNGIPAIAPEWTPPPADPAAPPAPRCFQLGRGSSLVCLPGVPDDSDPGQADPGAPGELLPARVQQDFSFLPVDDGLLGLIDTPQGAQPYLIIDDAIFDAAAITAMLNDDDPVPPPDDFAPGTRGTITFLPEVGDETLVGFLVNIGGDTYLLPAVIGSDQCQPGASISLIVIGRQAHLCGGTDDTTSGGGAVDARDLNVWRENFGSRSAGLLFTGELEILGDGSVRVTPGIDRVEDILITGDLETAIGLLLPAVQKVREAAARMNACGDSDFGLLLPAVQLCDGSVMPGDGSVMPGQIVPLGAFGDGSVVPSDLLLAMGDGSVMPGAAAQLLTQVMGDGSVAPALLSLIPSAVDLTGDGSVIPGELIQMGDGSVFILAPGDNQLLLGDGSVIPAPLGAMFGVIGGQAFLVLPPAAGIS